MQQIMQRTKCYRILLCILYRYYIHIQNSCFLLPCQSFPPFPYLKLSCFIGRNLGQSLFWTCTSQFSVNPCRFRAKLSLMELGIFMLLKGAKSDNILIKKKERRVIHVNKLLIHCFILKSSKFIISMQTFFPLDILQKRQVCRLTIKIQKFSNIIQQQRNNQRFIFSGFCNTHHKKGWDQCYHNLNCFPIFGEWCSRFQ